MDVRPTNDSKTDERRHHRAPFSLSGDWPSSAGYRWFLPFRIATYVLIFGAAVIWMGLPDTIRPLFIGYSIITLGMALGVTFSRRRSIGPVEPTLVWLHFLVEIAMVSAVVLSTGNVNSPFLGLFILTIVSAALVCELVGTLVVASAVSTGYVLAVWIGLSRSVDFNVPALKSILALEGTVSYSMLLHIFMFYLVALISGILAHRLRAQDRKLADTSLALKRARLETDDILRHLNSGLLTIDHTGSIIYFNRTAERILGYGEEQVRGLPCTRVFSERMPELSRCLCDGIERGVEHPRREFEIINCYGRSVPIGVSTSILRDEDGSVRGVIGIFSDLTAAKDLEEKMRAADRLAAVGELSASIAHEIRNPLAAISGSVEVLKRDLELSGQNDRLMDLIVKESHRLSRILTDFLTYSRIGRTSYARVELCHLVGEVLQLARNHQAYNADVEIVFESREVCVYVVGDDDLIRQLLMNLVINACESLTGRQGRVGVKITRRTSSVVLDVSDTGPGIAPQTLARIFEPFYSTKKQGTGLGLAIVHRICSMLKLDIQVESAPGVGTTFHVEFPLHGHADNGVLSGVSSSQAVIG
ncbi:MAG: PAS domain S-box protein [candidate division Zixibacteria bacterium]|nr:PAS domain S-box protein [candidate division Zixibacteria bacterium]